MKKELKELNNEFYEAVSELMENTTEELFDAGFKSVTTYIGYNYLRDPNFEGYIVADNKLFDNFEF